MLDKQKMKDVEFLCKFANERIVREYRAISFKQESLVILANILAAALNAFSYNHGQHSVFFNIYIIISSSFFISSAVSKLCRIVLDILFIEMFDKAFSLCEKEEEFEAVFKMILAVSEWRETDYLSYNIKILEAYEARNPNSFTE